MLRIYSLNKNFGSSRALKSINLDLAKGEIHGLVGINGSGKTTLLNILFGSPIISRTGSYTGDIRFDGVNTRIDSPVQALKLGIGMIHQETALIPGMSVMENIKLGREKTCAITEKLFGRQFSLIDRGKNRVDASHAISALGFELEAEAKVGDLSLSLTPFVEIARQIDQTGLKLLLLDEPTAALNVAEVHRLMLALRRLSERGIAILYVSHRLEEVLLLSDRVTVLREGEIAGRFAKEQFDLHRIEACMTGGRIMRVRRTDRNLNEGIQVAFKDFCVTMPGASLNGLCLNIRKGEILGLCGLSGQGQSALGPGVMGLFPTSGKIIVDGEDIRRPEAANMLKKGICFLPEDRMEAGLLPGFSVMENLIFTAVQVKDRFLRKGLFNGLRLVNRSACEAYARFCVERFQIKCRSVHQPVVELSGGNQQKVCIARALSIEPKVLLVAEPTRGVDVGAKEIILSIFNAFNRQMGLTFVIVSSEIDELRRVCDRIAVLHQGRIVQILDPCADDDQFTRALSGKRQETG
jgi:simple sugar transport system ATP-binding protein